MVDTYNCRYFLFQYIDIGTYIILSLLLICIFSLVYLKNYRGSRAGDIGFILTLVGGLLNILEWVSKECVRDYLNFFNLFHFNLYDIMVSVGILLMAITIWKKK
jgi:lipoprotein signal peptidase